MLIDRWCHRRLMVRGLHLTDAPGHGPLEPDDGGDALQLKTLLNRGYRTDLKASGLSVECCA